MVEKSCWDFLGGRWFHQQYPKSSFIGWLILSSCYRPGTDQHWIALNLHKKESTSGILANMFNWRIPHMFAASIGTAVGPVGPNWIENSTSSSPPFTSTAFQSCSSPQRMVKPLVSRWSPQNHWDFSGGHRGHRVHPPRPYHALS